MSEADLEESLATYVATGSYDRLPAHARRVATVAIRDCLAVLLAGLDEPSGRVVAEQARDDAGADGPSSALGRGFRVSPAAAAWVNGTTAHALDFDDSHHPSMTHPTAVLLPALLAVAEQRRRSGRDLLTAYLYALDAATAIGGGLSPDHYSAGWHPTATIGALGAALGAARLSDLDPDRTAQALRIAASRASGSRGVFGSMGKALNAGAAAQTGVVAAALAARGFITGPGVLVDFAARHGAALRLSHALDGSFDAAVGGLSLKRFPSCGVTQAPIEAALRLADPARADHIVEVVCTVDPYIRRLIITQPPRTGNEARFNLEHCVAVALVDGAVGMAQFDDARVADPVLRAVAATVRIEDRPATGAGPDLRWPCALRVVWADGRVDATVVDEPAGRGPGELLPESELSGKVTDCVRWAGLSDAEAARFLAHCDQLAALDTLDPLLEPLRRTLRRVDTTL